ncbi:MAG: DMT family transporter [Desulfotalea sp.]
MTNKSIYFRYISLLATMFLWGGTFISGRILGETLAAPISAFLRFAVASLTLLIILKISKGYLPRPQKNQWIPLTLLGMSGIFAYNMFFFEGLKFISGGRAALIISATPLVVAIIASFFLKEKLNTQKSIGIFLSLIGAIFVISNGHPLAIIQGGFGHGETLLLGCVISWSAYTLIGRSILGEMQPLVAVTYSCIIGTFFLSIPAFQAKLSDVFLQISAVEWFNIIYLGVGGTALGFWWYYLAIKDIGASKTAIFINLVPLFAIILSHFILGESVKFSVLLGGIMVLSGVTITNLSKS